MFGNSQTVNSDQNGSHPNLHSLVVKHQQQPLQRPVNEKAKRCFADLINRLSPQDKPLLIDAGCGTGESSLRLARLYPDNCIIGIDKSAHRLGRSGLKHDLVQQDNCILIRMKLEDFYPLSASCNWQVSQQYFLYPNPWPKAKHIQRRWHAHGLFPWMIKLGGKIELRCNWSVYAEEFLASLTHYPQYNGQLCQLTAQKTPLSPFEAKYLASDQPLYQCLATPVLATNNQE